MSNARPMTLSTIDQARVRYCIEQAKQENRTRADVIAEGGSRIARVLSVCREHAERLAREALEGR